MACIAGSPPNVLLLSIEDNNPNVWGCYGAENAHTPQVDRLAATGVRFDRAYCQATSCNPSRTSFLTGRRPESTRVTANPHDPSKLMPADILSMPEVLHTAGYHTINIGKIFHSAAFAPRQLAAFDVIEYAVPPSGWNGPASILSFPPEPKSKLPLPDPIRPADDQKTRHRKLSDRYGDSGLAAEAHKDRRMARTAAAHLQRLAQDRGQPFFMALGFVATHTPLIAPQEFIVQHPVEQVKLPEGFTHPISTTRYHQRVIKGNPDLFMSGPADDDQTRAAIAAYRACTSFADSNVGIVLDALQQSGLEENTIVILLGDHGFHLGDHGLWSKYTLLESNRRAPLIIRAPGITPAGGVCGSLVEFIDLMPTLCDLTHVKPPAALEGKSLLPVLRNPAQPFKDAVFTTDQDGSRCVRTERWSYMKWNGSAEPKEALFDLITTPWRLRT